MDLFDQHLGTFRGAQVKAMLRDITCGEGCWKAKEDICRCECGGKNHGIHLRGENAIRASRQNGYRYELLEVGTYKNLLERVEQLCRDANVADGTMRINADGKYECLGYTGRWFVSSYIHPTDYNRGGGEYVLKYASLPQCLKWQELEYFECANDVGRYHKSPAILWKRADIDLGT